jgi:type I restriction enzyme, S subunit
MTTSTVTIWKTARLGDVADIERSAVTPEQIEAGTKFVGLENITSAGEFLDVRPVSNGELASNKFIFSPKHVLYGKLRPYLAKIACPTFSGVCSTDILPILPGPGIDRRYLCYFLRQPYMVEFAASRCSGANLPRLSPNQIAEFQIPIPWPDEAKRSRLEQKRIADILDKADAVRRKSREVIHVVEELSDSLFRQTSSDTGAAPRTISELLESEVLLVHKDGNYGSSYPQKHEFGLDGIPFLSAKHVAKDGTIITDDVPHLTEEKARSLPFGWIEPGDVLLAHNATVGPVALYRGQYPEALIGTSLTCFRPNPKYLTSEFLFAALRGSHFQRQLQKEMSQTTRNQVPITAQRRLTLFFPSLNEQIAFTSQLTSVHRLRAKQMQETSGAKELYESLVQRAFRGEL